jgi:hypothetical protein
MGFGINRKTLRPGEPTLVWSRNKIGDWVANPPHTIGYKLSLKDLFGNVTIPKTSKPVDQQSFDDQMYFTQIEAPQAIGKYDILLNGIAVSQIEVISLQTEKPWVTVNPGDESKIQSLIDAGNNILLSTGEYHFKTSINLKPYTKLRGINRNSVKLVKDFNAQEYANKFFTPAAFCSFDNLTIEMSTGSFCQKNWSDKDAAINVTVSNCVFRGIFEFGEWDRRGLIIKDCDFYKTTINQITSNVLIQDCKFMWGNEPTSSWGADSLAFVNCIWEHTGRGITFHGIRGSQTNFLGYRLFFKNIDWVDNGGEIFLWEKAPVYDSLIMHVRTSHCVGNTLQFWWGEAKNNLFIDFSINGNDAIWFAQTGTADEQRAAGLLQTGNTFKAFEITGGLVNFGYATGNTFIESAILSPQRKRGNQFWWNDSFYKLRPVFTAQPNTNNIVKNVRVCQIGNYTLSDGNEVMSNVLVV